MSAAEPGDGSPKEPKPKRPMNDAQRAALAKGQAALAARRAERKLNGLVPTTSAEVREAQAARAAASPPRAVADPDPELERPERSNGRARVTPIRSIEDVARRRGEPEPPPIDQVARETRLYTLGSDPLPPPEDEPHLNEGMIASSGGEVEDLAGVQPPKNLADLMNQCPTIGDGQYYIEVIRRAPQQFGGVICKGTQRPIQRYMTDRDFVGHYGGGDYTLVLYGPPKRGGVMDPRTGRMRHKALSPPVKVEISPSVYPPNLQAAVLHDDESENESEGDDMRYIQPGFSQGSAMRPTTTADARMLEVQLEHEEKMRAREEAKEREVREERAGMSASLGPMLDVVHRNSIESVKALERQAEQRARQAEAQAERAEEEKRRAEARSEQVQRESRERDERDRNRPTDAAQMVDGFAKMAAVLKPSESASAPALAAAQAEAKGAQAEAKAAKEALDQARQEIQRLMQSHTTEVQRIQEKHASELKRVQDDYRDETTRRTEQARNEAERLDRQNRDEMKRQEERLKENIDRAERRAEEAERKAETRVQETETRAERRLAEVREEMRRALDDQRAQNQTRLDDERRQHERDLKSQQTTYETRLAGQKDMLENRVTTVGQEITRLTAEAERWRKEAEENKDIGKHIERAQEAAAALGWGPSNGAPEGPEPPKDWKDMLGRIGMDLVQKLPEIVQSAGETVSKLRASPGPSPEQVQAMQYQAMQVGAQNSMARQMAGVAPMGGLPPPLRGRDGNVFQPSPLRFGTEDASGPLDPGAPQPRAAFDQFGMHTPPPQPQAFQTPAYQPPPQGYAPPPEQTYAQPPPAYQPPPPPQTYQPQTYQPQGGPPAAPPQLQQAAPEPTIPQAPPGSVPTVIPPEMILQFAPVLEQAMASGEPVESIARELLPLLGRENLVAVITGLKPERVVVELQKAGKGASPLVRRQGQQFLRDLWAAASVVLAQG